MTSLDAVLYTLFPVTVGFMLLSCRTWLYVPPENVNQSFETSRRPLLLRMVLRLSLILLPLVFLALHAYRLPFFLSVGKHFFPIDLSGQHAVLLLKIAGFTLGLFCELLVVCHLWYYLWLCWLGAARYVNPQCPPLSTAHPKVAVLIPTCDEKVTILARSVTTVSRLAYPNLQLLLVENSRATEAKAQAIDLAAQYGLQVADIKNRGHKAGALNDAEVFLDDDVKYIAVVDADQSIKPHLLRDVIPLLEQDARVAFVQTPQLYENCAASLLACAASQQQLILYDGVLEGKAVLGLTPCYGSNFVMRRAALKEVGGWDESNVTEDVTTSFYLHACGWRSLYKRDVYAMGIAPPTLQGYWKQQGRWALGNSTLVVSLLRQLLRGELRDISLVVVVNYLWSASFYVMSFAMSALALMPTLIFLHDRLVSRPMLSEGVMAMGWPTYFSLYAVYVCLLFFPYFNMSVRGYRWRHMLLVQGLVTISSHISLRIMLQVLRRSHPVMFETSPKIATAHESAWRGHQLLIQCLPFLLFLVIGSVSLQRVGSAPGDWPLWLLVFWSFVHALSVGHFFLLAFPDQRSCHSSGEMS